MMYFANVEKECAEVRRDGLSTDKIEVWSWAVNFSSDSIDDDFWLDRHYTNHEIDARWRAALFEAGAFTFSREQGVNFDNAFEDVSDFELELEDWFEGEVDDSTLEFEVINK